MAPREIAEVQLRVNRITAAQLGGAAPVDGRTRQVGIKREIQSVGIGGCLERQIAEALTRSGNAVGGDIGIQVMQENLRRSRLDLAIAGRNNLQCATQAGPHLLYVTDSNQIDLVAVHLELQIAGIE